MLSQSFFEAAHMIGRYTLETADDPTFRRLLSQHAGPNDRTYSTGSPTNRVTVHGQRGFLPSSFMPGFYP